MMARRLVPHEVDEAHRNHDFGELGSKWESNPNCFCENTGYDPIILHTCA